MRKQSGLAASGSNLRLTALSEIEPNPIATSFPLSDLPTRTKPPVRRTLTRGQTQEG
jgi:hypothetical protein